MTVNYRDMTDGEIKEAVSQIVRKSSSKEEVDRRLRDELQYPYGTALHAVYPPGSTDLRNAMVMGMMHGPRGVTSF